jgi:hypothetical protein
VIKVEAQPRHSEDTIIKNALQRLTRIQFDFIPPFDSAKRVIFWYRLFTIGRSPSTLLNEKSVMDMVSPELSEP